MRSDQGLAAAILAGGHARRYGGIDKSALTIGGVPILQRIVDTVRPNVAQVFAVGDHFGAAATLGLDVIEDAIPDAGALGGIYTAVAHSPCERTLVIACDMPFVSTRFVERLAAERDADVVMAHDAKGYQPLCAIYTRACEAALRQRLERGERHAAVPPPGMRLVEIGPAELSALDPEGLLFVNVNTPHDYERARRIVEAGRAPA